MIKVNRSEKPFILEQNEIIWKENYLRLKSEFDRNPTLENKNLLEKAQKKYNHEEVKAALKTMFHNKCAFCESNITHIYSGDIEHFRPKSKFPDFCFDWNNMLLACSICNGKSNKGDKFPLEHEGGLLINPVDEHPNDFFRFEFDDLTKVFLLIPINERAETMLKTVKLNREDLAEFRTRELTKIIKMITSIKNDNETLRRFVEIFSPKDQYYAFIFTILSKIK